MGSKMSPDELSKALSDALSSLQQKAKSVAAGSVLPNLTMSALAEGAVIKQLHTHLQRAAHSARAAALQAQQAAANELLDLENARYEAQALERELEQCAAVATPHLGALGLDLPTSDTPEAHEKILKTLQSELDRRIELADRVVALRKERDERAHRVRKAEESLESLPKRVRRLAGEAAPLRKFFLPEDGASASIAPPAAARPADIGLHEWSQLPAPLYVLARQALACAAANAIKPATLTVKARRPRNGVISGKDVDKGCIKALHRTHEWMVDLEIRDIAPSADGGALYAILGFQYHTELNIVSVCVFSDFIEAAQFSELFPNDSGRQSPNLANAYLLDGKFAFDGSLGSGRGGKARAFRWANALCGLHFLPETVGDVQENHVRFTDTLAKIVARVCVAQALRLQVRTIRKKVRERSKSNGAFLDKFDSVDNLAVNFPCATTDATIFKIGCHAGHVKNIAAHIVVPASYPSPPPSLYVEREGSISEANIRQIESEVNKLQDTDENNMLLTQVEKFLHCVSIAGAGSSVKKVEDSGENNLRHVRGRGRVMSFTK